MSILDVFKKKPERFIFILIFTYKFSLDYIYLNYITDFYASIGLVENVNIFRYLISIPIMFLSIIPLKKMFNNFEKPSSIMMITFYLLYFYPNLTFCSLSNPDIYFYLFSLLYWFILTIMYLHSSNKKYILIKGPKNPRYFYFLIFSVIFISVAFTAYYNGFNIKFDLKNIYEIRADVKLMSVSTIFGYLKPAASKFAQIGLIYFLINKNKILAAFMVLAQLMFFAFGAHKTDFFFLILSIIIYYFYNNKSKHLILYGLVLINMIIIFFVSNQSSLLVEVSSIYTRILFTPNILSSYFFDFFTSNENLYFRDNLNQFLGLGTTYGMEIPYLIAIEYRNAPGMQANTGLIGSDFAEFGWLSLIFLIPIRVFLMNLLDSVSYNLEPKLLLIVSFSFSFSFINGSLLGQLLTGGFFAVCLLLYFTPRIDLPPKNRTVQ